MSQVSYKKEETIFDIKNEDTTLYIVFKGSIILFKNCLLTKRTEKLILKKGDIFGNFFDLKDIYS